MGPSTQFFLKTLPIYPFIDRVRDWYTLQAGRRKGTFSQHGEDRFVLDYFGKRPGFYVDVGANHPFRISNTYLLYLNGWRGITIEPMPDLSRKHRQYRPDDRHFNIGAGACEGRIKLYCLTPSVLTTLDEEVASGHLRSGRAVLSSSPHIRVSTISSVLQEAQFVEHIDFLNIDCEGYDLRVLQGVDWSRTKPTLICVETGQIGGSDQTRQHTETDICDFLTKVGYRVLTRRDVNTFFVMDESPNS